MRWLVALCTLVFALVLADTTLAQIQGCRYNGKIYPIGTKLGSLRCMPDGRWR